VAGAYTARAGLVPYDSTCSNWAHRDVSLGVNCNEKRDSLTLEKNKTVEKETGKAKRKNRWEYRRSLKAALF